MMSTPLTLLAAGSLRRAFLPLVAHFQQHTGLAVDAQFGPAGLLRERIEAALHQIEFAAEIKGERLACLEARSQFCWYLRGVPHANAYKQEVVHVETLDDLRRITRAIQRDLRD